MKKQCLITLRLVANRVDKESHTVEVEEGTTIKTLLLRPRALVEDIRLAVVNSVETDSDQIFGDGDRISIFPAAAGG